MLVLMGAAICSLPLLPPPLTSRNVWSLIKYFNLLFTYVISLRIHPKAIEFFASVMALNGPIEIYLSNSIG